MSIDGSYTPFDEYPNYSSMAPCIRSCDDNVEYNGCDQARCWCTKPNLDLRIASVTRCASSKCSFANMNTQTDVDILSGVQVMYCADKGFSPAGMTMPVTSEATPTGSSDTFSSGTATFTGSSSRTGLSLGPSSTSGGSSSNSRPEPAASGLPTAAKAGMAVGAVFCVLLLVAIILLLRRRRHPPPQFYPPPPQNPSLANTNFSGGPLPPQMAPTPYSGHGPYSPPPLQQPVPLHIPPHAQQQNYTGYKAGDVSPIEEKPNPLTAISRKEVGGGFKKDIESPTPPSATPASPSTVATSRPHIADNGPLEVQGSVPSPKHEVSTDGEITNTVTTRGMELDGTNVQRPVVSQYPSANGGVELPAQQPQQQPQYQQSPQGQWGYGQQYHAHEVDGGQHGWVQRHEVDGGQYAWGQGQGQGQRHEVDGGNNQWGPGQGTQRQEFGGSSPRYGGPGLHELGGR